MLFGALSRETLGCIIVAFWVTCTLPPCTASPEGQPIQSREAKRLLPKPLSSQEHYGMYLEMDANCVRMQLAGAPITLKPSRMHDELVLYGSEEDYEMVWSDSGYDSQTMTCIIGSGMAFIRMPLVFSVPGDECEGIFPLGAYSQLWEYFDNYVLRGTMLIMYSSSVGWDPGLLHSIGTLGVNLDLDFTAQHSIESADLGSNASHPKIGKHPTRDRKRKGAEIRQVSERYEGRIQANHGIGILSDYGVLRSGNRTVIGRDFTKYFAVVVKHEQEEQSFSMNLVSLPCLGIRNSGPVALFHILAMVFWVATLCQAIDGDEGEGEGESPQVRVIATWKSAMCEVFELAIILLLVLFFVFLSPTCLLLQAMGGMVVLVSQQAVLITLWSVLGINFLVSLLRFRHAENQRALRWNSFIFMFQILIPADGDALEYMVWMMVSVAWIMFLGACVTRVLLLGKKPATCTDLLFRISAVLWDLLNCAAAMVSFVLLSFPAISVQHGFFGTGNPLHITLIGLGIIFGVILPVPFIYVISREDCLLVGESTDPGKEKQVGIATPYPSFRAEGKSKENVPENDVKSALLLRIANQQKIRQHQPTQNPDTLRVRFKIIFV